MQCRHHVGQLVQLYPQLQKSGAEVLVILGDHPQRARRYAKILKTSFPVLADPERHSYELFGLGKAYLIIQRSASVVIDRRGVVSYIKRATNPLVWLGDNRELVDIVASLLEHDKASVKGSNAT
jgi:peroxiredoxin